MRYVYVEIAYQFEFNNNWYNDFGQRRVGFCFSRQHKLSELNMLVNMINRQHYATLISGLLYLTHSGNFVVKDTP